MYVGLLYPLESNRTVYSNPSSENERNVLLLLLLLLLYVTTTSVTDRSRRKGDYEKMLYLY